MISLGLVGLRLLLVLQLFGWARSADDFADVNAILGDVVVKMPDVPTMSTFGSSIQLTELVCRNLFLRDSFLTSRSVGLVQGGSNGVQLEWSIQGLAFECNAKYLYRGLLGISNTGDVYLNSRGNNAVATATVSAPLTGSPQPPTKVTMNACDTEVQIVDIDFDNGGFIGWVLDAIEALLRDAVENMASDKICEELQVFLEVNTKDVLEYIAGENVLKPYLPTASTATSMFLFDSLKYEDDFIQNAMANENKEKISTNSSTTELLNLREQGTSTGRWMNELIRKGVDASNEMISDPLNVMVEEELRVNQWIRDFVLDDGALVLTSSSSANGFPGGGVLYDGEDLVTHTTIVLDRFKLLGLDTLTRFSPLEAIGNYTLETNLAWKYLALELDATVTVRPSTRPDAIIETTTTSSSALEIVEEVKVILGVDGLEAGASLMAALNRTALENSIELGSLLKSGKAAMDCLLSTILDLEFATVSVKVADALTPSVEGLVSPGLDRLVSQGMDASFLLYEKVLLEAAPIYFQNELRPILSKKILREFILNDYDSDENRSSSSLQANHGRQCLPWATEEMEWFSENSKTVDFRDLLMPMEEAIALGGSGSEAYGDVLSGKVVPYINKELLDPDALNAQLIPTMTKEQSGKEGALEFNNVFRRFEESSASPLYDTLDFGISKIIVSNLDTVEGPLEFLQPTNRGNVLRNRFAMNAVTDAMGNDLRYLNVTFRVYLEMDGDDSPFQMNNEVDFSVSVPSTSFSFEILADLREKSLLEFPLKDIANPYCWLAALISPTNNEENKEGLAISNLSFSLATFYFDTYCVSASSPGCDSISEVIKHLKDAGLTTSLQSSVVNLVKDVVSSLWDTLDVKGMVDDAKKHCPHSEFYDDQETGSLLELPDLSGISKDSSETVFALGIIGLHTAMVVSAKNHLLLDQQLPTLGNQSMAASSEMTPFPEGGEIIDWTNLSGQFGGWVDILFDEFRESLSRSTENVFLNRKLSSNKTPRVNTMLRDYVLDDSGNLQLPLDDISFTTLGVTVSITKIQIGGLDTIAAIKPLVVVNPYEMHTDFQIDELTMTLEYDVTTVDDASIDRVIDQGGLIYRAKNVLLDIDTRIALNTTEIAQIQIGSLFDSSKVFSCMMKGIQAFEVSKLNLTLGELESSTIEGSFSSGLREELSGILDALHDEYQNEILLAMPLIARSTMREIINTMIPSILKSKAMECPSPPEFPKDGTIDFRELFLPDLQPENLGGKNSSSYGDIFQILYDILDREVMQTDASNRPVINDLLKKLTKKQSNITGMIRMEGNALDTQTEIQIAGLRANLTMELSNVTIENLDSVGDPLYFLQPVSEEANVLDNKISFGIDPKPLQFQGTLALSIDDGANMNITNEIDLSFQVKDVTVQASILLRLLENSISSFPLKDFSNINCWAATILPTSNKEMVFDGLQILDQVYSTGDFKMEISCRDSRSCTSPDFDEFLLSLYEPRDITAVVREQTGNLMDSELGQKFIKDYLVESKKRCPHHAEFDPNYENLNSDDSSGTPDVGFQLVPPEKKKNPMYFSIANSVIAGCLIIAGILGKFMLARNNKKWVQSLTREGQFLLHCQQEKQRGTDEWLDENTTSLFASPFIPKSIRWGVPILLLVNTGLYLGGHFGLLSIMNLDITFAGQSFTIEEFLEFRFIESTKKTYDSGGAEMIILLWICTGIWPYIKILLSLAIWMTPPNLLSVKRRRSLLLWIDALVRLSIIDIFTLIIAFAILLVFIGGRDQSISEEGMYYSLKAIVVPKAGCYCIIVAQRMSRVSSQFFLEYHGKVVERAKQIRKEKEGDMSISQVLVEDQSRGNSSFETDQPSIHIADANTSNCQNSQSDLETAVTLSQIPTDLSFFSTKSWKAYRWGHLGAILGGITISIVFIIGLVFVPAIALDISTLGGIGLESEYTYDEAVSEYGVFLVISGILLKARFVLKTKADYIGLGLLLIAAGLSVAFMFVIKSYHFIRKKIQERKDRRHNLNQKPSYGHEGCGLPSYFRLYKWNHMEIYFISLCIGVWQLGSIISYSIHLYCSILTGLFDILVAIGIAKPTEAQCNRIQATLVGNLVITIGSFLILLAVFILQAWGQYKKNLEYASKYIDDKDVPTLSLAWSQDKSKNTRYSHLTESLSFSAIDSDGRSSMASSTLITNESDKSFPQTRIDSRCGSDFTASSTTTATNRSIRFSPSEDVIEEGPNEDDVSVPIASLVSDVSSRCSDRSSTIDAPCELANTTDILLRERGANNYPYSRQNVQGEILSHQRPEWDEDISFGSSNSQHIFLSRSFEDSASVQPPSPPRSAIRTANC